MDALMRDTAPALASDVAGAYREFVARRSNEPADPYYSEERVRFWPADDDVLVAPADLRAEPSGCGVVLASARAGAKVEVCGLSLGDAGAIVRAVDGETTARAIRTASNATDQAWSRFVEGAFGRFVFSPAAVDALERRVSFAEIVRYPGSPYEIVRAYWVNMGAVSEKLSSLGRAPRDLRESSDTPTFVALLRELHVAALVGDGASFYLPASPIAGKGAVEPGQLLERATELEDTPSGVRIVAGARVNAEPIGGDAYQRLLAAFSGDPESLATSRHFVDDGLSWGRIVTARADGDDRDAAWFFPPRPLEVRHFDSLRDDLRASLAAAAAGDRRRVVASLARFHQKFVRLHPFRCANQCLAMSFVNHVLRRSHGAGIPHLVLDHLALRLSPAAYAWVFAVAVDAWCVTGSAIERHAEFASKKRRAFAFLAELARVPTFDDARHFAAARSDDARLVLLKPREPGPRENTHKGD
ncbi:MAG TPA: hypothetical protein VH142_21665 [Polyangiaceae bacterium]|nr:hypothetical protein [Polyangiaceae bacterium]